MADIAQKMTFSIKDFFSKCNQICRKLKKFTEEILNGKLHFLCNMTLTLLFDINEQIGVFYNPIKGDFSRKEYIFFP